jgi:diguanylate cyclase (GGDEF)-like protein/PAS domain S-box-containing protein
MTLRKSPSSATIIFPFAQQTFLQMFSGHSAIMLLIAPDTGKILDANQAAINFYGYSHAKLCRMNISDINILPPEQVAVERRKAVNGEENSFVFAHHLAGGEERIVGVHSSPITLRGKLVLFSIIHDVTQHVQAGVELQNSEARYRTLFDNMMDGIYRSTHEGRFIDVNPAMVKMFGYSSREEMLAVDIKKEMYFSPEERGSHVLDTGQEETEVYRMRRKDGSEIWVEDHGHYVHDDQGNILYHEGMLRDITARKQAEADLHQAKADLEAAHRELENAFVREQQLARTDALTGIINRRYLFELAEREFDAALRYHTPLSVLMFDVDDFKHINDNFGHALGDQALSQIAQVVLAQLRSVDVFGRYGGDEFIILLPQSGNEEALVLGERIHASITSMRMNTNLGMISLTISMGIAGALHHTAQADSVEDLFQRADRALYEAKQLGRNRTVVSRLR